jgi:hypothetical protein
MKYIYFLLLLITFFSSCLFGERHAFIVERKVAPERKIAYVGEDSIEILFDQNEFIKYTLKNTSSDSVKNILTYKMTSSVISIDSIETWLANFDKFDHSHFWIQQLDKGKVYLIDLNTGKHIRIIKRNTYYYKESLFTKVKTTVAYKKHKKSVYDKRFLIVDF